MHFSLVTNISFSHLSVYPDIFTPKDNCIPCSIFECLLLPWPQAGAACQESNCELALPHWLSRHTRRRALVFSSQPFFNGQQKFAAIQQEHFPQPSPSATTVPCMLVNIFNHRNYKKVKLYSNKILICLLKCLPVIQFNDAALSCGLSLPRGYFVLIKSLCRSQ